MNYQEKPEQKYPAIEFNDMVKLMKYYDPSDPVILQHGVTFKLIYYFLLRGHETHSRIRFPFLLKMTASTVHIYDCNVTRYQNKYNNIKQYFNAPIQGVPYARIILNIIIFSFYVSDVINVIWVRN